MSTKSKLFYWIECDHPGCTARSPAADYEIVAWSEASHADAGAQDDGWSQFPEADICPDHAVQYCDECGRHIGPLAGEQDYICDVCTPSPARR